ncbi:MAG: hypothetical protein GEU75_01505 [Dehalococcoidia bacterium]|nr:hypothetical protein [Dehalococcoidia bacterium]
MAGLQPRPRRPLAAQHPLLAGALTVIDFPQATDPRFNRSADQLLARDIANVCRYFAGYGISANAEMIAGDMWHRFVMGEL